MLKSMIFFFMAFSAIAAPNNFGNAKSILRKSVYPVKGKTFYCGCDYQKRTIVTKGCFLKIKKFKKRIKRLEWEHVVPVAAFGHSFKEYREAKSICLRKGKRSLSPRKCASKKNKLFREMEANLHNLVPAVGAVNALRSNYSFSDLNDSSQILCGAGFKLEKRKVEAPNSRKGDIARIYLYMNQKYPNRGIISSKNIKLFTRWDQLDPVDSAECMINQLKTGLQGETNPFVSNHCKAFLAPK